MYFYVRRLVRKRRLTLKLRSILLACFVFIYIGIFICLYILATYTREREQTYSEAEVHSSQIVTQIHTPLCLLKYTHRVRLKRYNHKLRGVCVCVSWWRERERECVLGSWGPFFSSHARFLQNRLAFLILVFEYVHIHMNICKGVYRWKLRSILLESCEPSAEPPCLPRAGVCIYKYTYESMYICVYIYIYAFIYICISEVQSSRVMRASCRTALPSFYWCLNSYKYTYEYMYISIYVQIYIYVHIYIYMCVCIYL